MIASASRRDPIAPSQTTDASPLSHVANSLSERRVGFRLLACLFLVLLSGSALFPPLALASSSSLGGSSLGQKVAKSLRSSSWPDEAIIFLLGTLPVLELRGAIPVSYWMHMDPLSASTLAVAGNMLPVPLILRFLGPLSDFLMERSSLARSFFGWLFEHTRKKAGPIEEFKWIGLMLFVAVPLPGTGAWSGAIAAYILGLPFWDAFTANLVGVILACLIVNLLCTLGLRYALAVGAALFLLSTFIWNILRWAKKEA